MKLLPWAPAGTAVSLLGGHHLMPSPGVASASGLEWPRLVCAQWQWLFRSDTYDSEIDRSGTATHEWFDGISCFLNGDDLKLSFNYHRIFGPAPRPDIGRLISRLQVVF